MGLTFVAFDVLYLAGERTTHLPWTQRRRLLELLERDGPGWCTVSTFDGDPDVVLEACGKHRLEGLVTRRTDGSYEPGNRSRSWVKVKTADWRVQHAPLRHDLQQRVP